MVEHAHKPLLSAIFVDYDNVYLSLKRRNEDVAKRFAKDARIWLDRIADGSLITPTRSDDGAGQFAPEQRRLAMARCYGNPIPRRHAKDNSPDMAAFPFVRQHFMLAGFEVADCPPLTTKLKNASDIRMVMDVRDVLDDGMTYDEFIILSGDADFTPLLHRLRARARRTVVYASAQTAPAFTSVCDAVIREELLLTVLNDGVLPEMLTPASDLVLTGEDTRDVRREIVEEVVGEIAKADGPVPLETLADKAQRALGHGRTAGTNWGGYGQFRALLADMLPDHIAITDDAPFKAYDTRRELATSAAPGQSQVTAVTQSAVVAEPAAMQGWPIHEDRGHASQETVAPVSQTPVADAPETTSEKPKRGLATTIAAFAARVAGTERDDRQASQPALDQGIGGADNQSGMVRSPEQLSERVVLDPLPAWGAAPDYRSEAAADPSQETGRAPEPGTDAVADAAVVTHAGSKAVERHDPWAALNQQHRSPASPEGHAYTSDQQATDLQPSDLQPDDQQPDAHRAGAQHDRIIPSAMTAPRTPAAPPTPARPSNTHASIQRIYDACQAPILGPQQYRTVFEIIASQLAERGMAGASTLQAIQSRLQAEQIALAGDDVRFILEVVTENDPWFEQGVSANIFAGRFRNFVVARCRSQGLTLAAQELDLIDAWFAGAPLDEGNKVGADVAARAGDLRATLEQSQRSAEYSDDPQPVAAPARTAAPVAQPPISQPPVSREQDVEVQADAAWRNIAAALGAAQPGSGQPSSGQRVQPHNEASHNQPQNDAGKTQPAPVQAVPSPQPPRPASSAQGHPQREPAQNVGAAVHASLAAQLEGAQDRRTAETQSQPPAPRPVHQPINHPDDSQEIGNLPRILRARATG